MKISLNWIKKYVELPEDLTPSQIAYDLTLRTVEVESIEYTKDKYHDIVVGKILEVKSHPNADTLRICIVDIGEEKPVQIVCGGSNLYANEYVVVSKPGAVVVWHGEGDPVVIKETKMRGEYSYGMICNAEEVFLEKFFPPKDESEIVDLNGIDCYPGQNISEVVCMDDVVLEIDNKSLTNRPDLWGHYGIARELSAIYEAKLIPIETLEPDKNLPKYNVEIKETSKCNRYVAVEIENVFQKDSPIWMKSLIINGGMRPINAIVDITNYVMLATGQPTHAFDRTHVDGNKIIVRNAKANEKLLLLDNNEIELTEDDLVISDENDAMGLAGIKGGKKDSILPETTGVLLEIASFTDKTIRKTGKRFDEKTDASMRYEKNIDTERVNDCLSLALKLFKDLFPESKVVSFNDVYPVKTQRAKIDITKTFLDNRLGKKIPEETIKDVLLKLGYEVNYIDGVFHVVAPVWRSTGDVSIKDDVMGDIARLLSFNSFEATPLLIKFDHAVKQNEVLLERRLKEYLSVRCGFNEIFTYPWIDDKYIQAAKIDIEKSIRLATPPAPELSILRSSLIPGLLEAVSKNTRYFDSFKIYEMAQVFEKGIYHESTEDETLPIHKKYLTGAIIGKNAKDIFYEAKGVIENMASFSHMHELTFEKGTKPSWADINAYLSVKMGEETIGHLALVSAGVLAEAKIKRVNVAVFELNTDLFVPYESRTNEFKHLPQFQVVQKDLSILVDKAVTWKDIVTTVKNRVKDISFVDEYNGEKIPEGKKSITFNIKLGKDDGTLTSEEINNTISSILKSLSKRFGAELREE